MNVRRLQVILRAAVSLLLLCTARPALAQPWVDWARQSPAGPLARGETSFVYDNTTGRVVLFGGYDLDWNRLHDTWEYEGATKTWTDVTPPTGVLPSPRWGQASAFDPVRRRMVVFGGQDDNLINLADTWEWDTVAKAWTNVTPSGSPAPRRGARLIYEAVNDRMILVGGVDDNALFGDTWSWSPGSRTWTKLNPSVSSSTGRPFAPRVYPGATYNSTTNRIVVFGGADLNDTWELRGNTWTDVTPSGALPLGRGWTQLVYDSLNDRIIMYAGWRVAPPTGSLADTWQFKNGVWTELVGAAAAVGGRDSQGMVYDVARQKVVAFGGYLADVIELSGSTWSRVLETVWPPVQDQHAMAYDSHRDVVFMYGGGNPEVWELTVATKAWQWYYVPGPNGRVSTAVAYDPNRRKMLLFGGRRRTEGALGARLGDTWEWDTAAHTWTDVSPGVSPPPREDHGLAYDAAHARAVLFGGRNASGTPVGDTWVWNGTAWSNVTATAAGPSARYGHAMAYDTVRNVIVLFGGHNGSTKLNDVWEWDGANQRWSQRFPSNPPAARAFAALSPFDRTTPGLALFGGSGASLLNDMWIWNGTAWSQAVSSAVAPTPRQHPVMVYAAGSQRTVLYGGRDARGISSELWLSSIVSSAAWPAPVSVSPTQGQGAAATFTAVFRHGAGVGQIKEVHLLVNSGPGRAGAAYLAYAPATNTLRLRNDNDSGWVSGAVGSSLSLSNSQVSVSLAGASVSFTSTDVQLNLPLVFKTAFNGSKQIYLAATSSAGDIPAGWQQKGVFSVSSGNSTPQMVSVTPVVGSGMSQTFTAVYRDLNGVSDLTQAYFLVDSTVSGVNAVYVYYAPGANLLHLRNDANSSWGTPRTPGSAGTLSNSQVSIDVARVTVTKTDTDLTLTLPMTFASRFIGQKNVYLMGVDVAGARPPLDVLLARFGVGTTTPGAPPLMTDLHVYRPTTGIWQILTAASGFVSSVSQQWGLPGDQPLRADFDGDQQPDLVVYRPSDGTWSIKFSTTAYSTAAFYQWGLSGDVPVVADFDGDHKADLVVFRPGDGTWWVRHSSSNFTTSASYQWGLAGDQPLQGDFDGDGKSDLAVYRPGTGGWYVRLSSTGYDPGSPLVRGWGLPGDVPMPEDFDGDGRSDLVVYRPADGSWSVWYSAAGFANGQWTTYQWGLRGDQPVLGDVDGDGRADLIVWRPSDGVWSIRLSRSAYRTDAWRTFQLGRAGDVVPRNSLWWTGRDLAVYKPSDGTWTIADGLTDLTTRSTWQWGLPGDRPLRADFDGDGRQDLVVYRPADGTWWIKFSSTNFTGVASYQWGMPGDVPVPVDYDGDGRSDLAVYRPGSGEWFIRYSSAHYVVGAGEWHFQWGLAGDVPEPADFDGDRRADLAVYRPATGEWLIRNSSKNFEVGAGQWYVQWGLAGDQPLAEDFDGDGKADFVVYRPGNGTWFVRTSADDDGVASYATYQWGLPGDQPVKSDLDGDGRADPTVWRPSTGTWYSLSSTAAYGTYRIYQLGQSTDLPLPVR